MDYYIEHRPALARSGKIKMVDETQTDGLTGFRSVYSYPKSVADLVSLKNSTAGLRGVHVRSDTLFLDFDDCVESAREFDKFLVQQGYEYTAWDSGNRSVHFHIPLASPMIGPTVPASQKKWVQEHAPKADVTFYHTSGIYRLPGTWHPKNPGHRKEIIKNVTGTCKLEIPLVSSLPTAGTHTNEDGVDKYGILCYYLTVPRYDISRDQMLFNILKLCRELGWDEHKAESWASFWNTYKVNPSLDPGHVTRKAEYVYRK